MAPQYSTSLSDGVLVISALYTAVSVFSISSFASIGFLLMATAASIGVVRFSLDQPSNGLVTWHKFMSQLTASLGLPMIAVAYLRHWKPSVAYLILIISLGFFAMQRYLSQKLVVQVGTVISAISMVTLLIQGFANYNVFAIFGVLLFAFAVVVVKTEGYIYSILRVDIFHYVLVLANFVLLKGLQVYILPNVFYSSSK